MHAPDAQEHIAYRYLRLGMSVIPLVPRGKKPYGALMEGTWAPFQRRPATLAQVEVWLQQDPTSNWGVVCGTVSGGTYCGDCDNIAFSRWVIEHARDPIFQGACIVETGAHKAHIWFRSPTRLLSGRWKPRSGKAVGDIRGDGQGDAGPSYMVVPPSIHPDTGDPYVVRAGSMDDLPTILNGEAYLQGVLTAYLSDHPEDGQPVERQGSKHILDLSPEESARVWQHVKDLRLKAKIRETIMVPGHQGADSKHWIGMEDGSGSGIDFAVVAELIRKNQSFEQIEQIFAACVIGAPRYRERGRPNHGWDYLKRTYDSAYRAVEASRQAQRVATGNNFRVLEATRLHLGSRDAVYRLRVVCVKTDHSEVEHNVELTVDDLLNEGKARAAVFRQTHFMLDFAPGHKGQHFWHFAAALSEMVTDIEQAPVTMTQIGYLGQWLREKLDALPIVDPRARGDTHTLGWIWDGQVYLRGVALARALAASSARSMSLPEQRLVLDEVGDWSQARHVWPSGEGAETVIVLTVRPA